MTKKVSRFETRSEKMYPYRQSDIFTSEQTSGPSLKGLYTPVSASSDMFLTSLLICSLFLCLLLCVRPRAHAFVKTSSV